MSLDRNTPDDAALIRYLDGEAGDEERARIDAALAADPGLADRLEALRRRSEHLHALMLDGEPAVPPALATFPRQAGSGPSRRSPAGRISLRAAAVVVLLGGSTMLVPAVRGWVIDGLQRAGILDAPAPAPVPLPVVPVDTLVISGFAAVPEFMIELEYAQPDGRLVVRVADVAEPQAELRTRGGGESFFVLPEGLRIVNQPTSTAEYVVTLPPVLRSIRVFIPGTTDTTWVPSPGTEQVFRMRD